MLLRRRHLLIGLVGLIGLIGLIGQLGLAGCSGASGPGAGAEGARRIGGIDPSTPSEASALGEASASGEASALGEASGPHDEDPEGGGREAVDLWIAGDLHWGEGGPQVLEPLRSLVPPGSLGVLNLEGPVGERPSDGVPPAAGEAPILSNGAAVPARLRSLGVAVVGVANNHADDLGAAGRLRTIEALRAVGIEPAGGDAGIVIVERGGLRLAVSAHYLRSGEPVEVREELREARAQVDHLIATFHVDAPPSYLPSAELRAGVEQAVDAGAVVVAAHGSHALARLERRGSAVVAWGLGNLAFACRCTDELDAGILRVRLGAGGVALAEWVPIAAGLDGQPLAPHPEAALLFQLMGSLRSSPGEVIDGRYRLDLGER